MYSTNTAKDKDNSVSGVLQNADVIISLQYSQEMLIRQLLIKNLNYYKIQALHCVLEYPVVNRGCHKVGPCSCERWSGKVADYFLWANTQNNSLLMKFTEFAHECIVNKDSKYLALYTVYPAIEWHCRSICLKILRGQLFSKNIYAKYEHCNLTCPFVQVATLKPG